MEPAASFDVLYNALSIEDKDKRIQTLRTLIDSGVDANSCWKMGDLLIHEHHEYLAKCESEGLTVLMVAARNGYVDCVHVLLDAGANVNQSNEEGQTALIEAAYEEHVECMGLLIKAGADVDQSESNGDTALMITATFGYVECERLLLEVGAGYVECMELLLEAGADVNDVDMDGNTALICCLISYKNSRFKSCLKLLITAGADIDVKNNKSLQPIHYALRCWQRATFPVEYLISENCNLTQVSYKQVEACVNRKSLNYVKLDLIGRFDILKLLFDCGLPRHLWQSFTVEQDTSVRNWVETVASQPNTLKSICVFKIRTNLGYGIKSKVTKLNLPNVIQNLILLKGILSIECFI